MRIDLLLLDVDGVLVQYQRARACCIWRTHWRFRRRPCRPRCTTAGWKRRMTMARWMARPIWRSWESFWAGLSMWRMDRGATGRQPSAAAVLQRLQALQLPMAVLTNNGALMKQALPTLLPELFPALQGRVFCSADFGLRKPAPAVFLRTLEAGRGACAHAVRR
jgi:putative hydrolase of the HAD superfamily